MSHYLVKKVRSCPECGGSGVVTHPAWHEYWEHHRFLLSSKALDAWFAERGYPYPPDEEIPCGTCNGTGVIVEEVDLKQALIDLGVLKR